VSEPLRFTGDLPHDALVHELLAVDRRLRAIGGEIRRRLEYGCDLRTPDQARRVRQFRDALVHRAVLRELQHLLDEARDLREERGVDPDEVVP